MLQDDREVREQREKHSAWFAETSAIVAENSVQIAALRNNIAGTSEQAKTLSNELKIPIQSTPNQLLVRLQLFKLRHTSKQFEEIKFVHVVF